MTTITAIETFDHDLARRVCLIKRTKQAERLSGAIDNMRRTKSYGYITTYQARLNRINARIMFLAGGGDAFDRKFCR